MSEKQCSMCKQTKGLMDFHKNSSMPDGLHFYCKDCHRTSVSERRSKSRQRLILARDVPGFLDRVTSELLSRSMSKQELAIGIGVKADTIYAWFNNQKSPHPRTQYAVASHLGIVVDEPAFKQNESGIYPDGLGCCECCGAAFPTYNKTFATYCSRSCSSKAQSSRQFGSDNPAYKNGKKLTDGGYVQILLGKNHPMAGRGGYALEHRFVMSEHLGRPLERYEVVHHINGDKTDNRIDNLELCGKDDARHPPGQRMRDVLISTSKHPAILALPDDVQEAVKLALLDVLKLNGFTI